MEGMTEGRSRKRKFE